MRPIRLLIPTAAIRSCTSAARHAVLRIRIDLGLGNWGGRSGPVFSSSAASMCLHVTPIKVKVAAFADIRF